MQRAGHFNGSCVCTCSNTMSVSYMRPVPPPALHRQCSRCSYDDLAAAAGSVFSGRGGDCHSGGRGRDQQHRGAPAGALCRRTMLPQRQSHTSKHASASQTSRACSPMLRGHKYPCHTSSPELWLTFSCCPTAARRVRDPGNGPGCLAAVCGRGAAAGRRGGGRGSRLRLGRPAAARGDGLRAPAPPPDRHAPQLMSASGSCLGCK